MCPTLECVASPADCGCPLSQDVKCPVGKEGAFVCARDCEQVKRAMRVK